jgi:long-chain acyl-CoA synthetase
VHAEKHLDLTDLKPKYRSIAQMFVARAAESASAEAFRYPVPSGSGDRWESLSWQQSLERVRSLACGLLSLGLDNEQRVGILCSTRVEWILADLAIMCAGGATTTVYPSSASEQCAFILADSETRYIFAEDASQVAKLRERKDELPGLQKVIVIDGEPDAQDGDWVITLDALAELGRAHHEANPGAFDERVESVQPEHLSTLIYTSGTTGKPKGVRLVHDCWTYEGEAMAEMNLLRPDDLQYLWLPLAHSFGKVLVAGQLRVGFPTAVDGRIPKLVDNLAVVRPTFMAAAPRIFEKVHSKVVQGAQGGGKLKAAIFNWSIGVGQQVSRLRQEGREPGGMLAFKARIADKLVFSKLKARFGGRVRFFISGSAPLSKDIAEFFHAADILILEGYGLTESSAASFVNRPDAYKFGTVGHPLPGTNVKIAEADGEILIKGRGIMRGYHNMAEESARTVVDGWLHTGDIGEIDSDGFLKITDRKKDLIKTSGGKYVAPQLIEGRFKAVCPYVSQVIVHGDRRKYCTVLITLDEESIMKWAGEHGLGGKPYEEVTQTREVRDLIQPYVDELNQGLERWETLKYFEILPRDLTVEEGELTPSLKVKRKLVEKKYDDRLERMYQE